MNRKYQAPRMRVIRLASEAIMTRISETTDESLTRRHDERFDDEEDY